MTKNLKGFVEILIVVLLAVVGIWIVGSFIVGPSFVIPTPTTESTPNPTENLPRDEDLRIWKTYRNEEYGFETKYPPVGSSYQAHKLLVFLNRSKQQR